MDLQEQEEVRIKVGNIMLNFQISGHPKKMYSAQAVN